MCGSHAKAARKHTSFWQMREGATCPIQELAVWLLITHVLHDGPAHRGKTSPWGWTQLRDVMCAPEAAHMCAKCNVSGDPVLFFSVGRALFFFLVVTHMWENKLENAMGLQPMPKKTNSIHAFFVTRIKKKACDLQPKKNARKFRFFVNVFPPNIHRLGPLRR